MKTIDYIRHEQGSMRRLVEMTMIDMTPEMFNWGPPGTANTISATFLHLVNVQDEFIHQILQGKPTLWEREKWSQRTGVENPPGMGEDWSSFKNRKVELKPMLEYKDAVWTATDAFLETLTEADLDRLVDFAGGQRPMASVLTLAAVQAAGHVGEIAALKGIQGVKGLPI